MTLNLRDGSYKPYRKPNSEIVYVHAHSNHPRSVKKNIPVNIEKRLNMLSSGEEKFNEAKGPYQEALIKSGYDYELKYKKVNLQDLNKKKNTREKYKQIFFCNPPHEDMVETPVGALILRHWIGQSHLITYYILSLIDTQSRLDIQICQI